MEVDLPESRPEDWLETDENFADTLDDGPNFAQAKWSTSERYVRGEAVIQAHALLHGNHEAEKWDIRFEICPLYLNAEVGLPIRQDQHPCVLDSDDMGMELPVLMSIGDPRKGRQWPRFQVVPSRVRLLSIEENPVGRVDPLKGAIPRRTSTLVLSQVAGLGGVNGELRSANARVAGIREMRRDVFERRAKMAAEDAEINLPFGVGVIRELWNDLQLMRIVIGLDLKSIWLAVEEGSNLTIEGAQLTFRPLDKPIGVV